MQKKKYRTIAISDVHLGTQDCQADSLTDFLKNNSSETLYLVGDILDMWKVQQNKWKWKQSHSDVIRQILKQAKHDTQVIYIAGNHDEFLRPLMTHGISFGRIQVVNQYEHIGVDGKRYLVIHGDMFDGISKIAPWLSILGDKAYTTVLWMNSKFNAVRRKFGFGYWSLSQYLKHRVKGVIDFMFDFENNLTEYCKKRKFDGVICGHIHKPEIKKINDVWYFNDGDFVESISALIETHNGDWMLIHLEENEWRPFQVLDRQTDQVLTGKSCIEWFTQKGFSVDTYQLKKAK